MRNLARGGVVLTLFILLIGVFFNQRKVEAITLSTNLSQEITTRQIETTQQNQDDKKKQAEKKADSEKVESQDINVEVQDEEAGTSRNFRATAYCLRGRTASGGSVRRGIVAADTRVLPLGTQITMDAGKYSGTYTVADTGGAVKGNKLDIWVPSCSEARSFGRRTVKVSVHGKRKRKK